MVVILAEVVQLLRENLAEENCRRAVEKLEQLKQFPLGDHDDGPDALEMAVRLASEMLIGPADDGLGHRLPVGE